MLETIYNQMKRMFEERHKIGSTARDELLLELANMGLRSLEGRSSVVWTKYFFPIEIIIAFDFIPFLYEVTMAIFANLGLAREPLEFTENRFFQRDGCSYDRSAIGAGLAGHLVKPRIMLSTSYLCDGNNKVFEVLSRHYNTEYVLLDVPSEFNKESIDYVEFQLRKIVERLEEIKGDKLDQDRLKETIVFSNQTRELMLKVNELRKNSPSPFHGWKAFSFIYLARAIWGTERLVEIYQKLVQELEDKVKTCSSDREELRILWLGMAMPCYKTDIFNFLEESYCARIVFEETSIVFWEELDERNPIRSLAMKTLMNPGLGEIEKRVTQACRMAEEYEVDGAIHFTHWGCRQSSGGVRILADCLAKMGVPMLSLDGDLVDNRNYFPGQVKTRLEGFMEMLR